MLVLQSGVCTHCDPKYLSHKQKQNKQKNCEGVTSFVRLKRIIMKADCSVFFSKYPLRLCKRGELSMADGCPFSCCHGYQFWLSLIKYCLTTVTVKIVLRVWLFRCVFVFVLWKKNTTCIRSKTER